MHVWRRRPIVVIRESGLTIIELELELELERLSVWHLSLVYIGPKSRTERPSKTKIGTEVVHVTRDSDTTFKIKRSKINLRGVGAYYGGLPHGLYFTDL